MSGWIKFDKDMLDDPRMIQLALDIAGRYIWSVAPSFGGHDLDGANLQMMATNCVLGAILRLWRYADIHIRDDDSLPLSLDALDALVGLKGFAENVSSDWVLEGKDGKIILPGYCEKNGLIAKRKRAAESNERVRSWRANRPKKQGTAKRGNGHATPPVTPPVTQTVTHSVTHVPVAEDLDQDLLLRGSLSSPVTESHHSESPQLPTAHANAPNEEPDWFAQFKLVYPRRAGDQGWRRALRAGRARLAEGHEAGELLAGAERYRTYIEATQKLGTEYVKQAATFLGPDKPFLNPWTPPPTRAENRLENNLSAAAEAKRRLFGGHS